MCSLHKEARGVNTDIILKSNNKLGGYYRQYRVIEVFKDAQDVLVERLDVGLVLHMKLSDLLPTDTTSEKWMKRAMGGKE